MAYVVLVIGQLGKLVGITPEGDIPSGLPAVRLPDAGLGDGLTLLPAALGIFFVSYSGEILTARAFAGDRGEHVRADTELGAMGAASLAAGGGRHREPRRLAWPGPDQPGRGRDRRRHHGRGDRRWGPGGAAGRGGPVHRLDDRLDDRLCFANAGYVTGRIHEAVDGNPTPVRWLVFDGEALPHRPGRRLGDRFTLRW